MKKHNIFNDTKYTRWYWAIIEKRAITDHRQRGEFHHIIPRSLGGTDDQSNLIKLSGHDHAWCHWLLTKMTTGEDRAKMVYAFNMMGVYGEHMEREKSYAIVRAYEKNRLEWSINHSDLMKEQFANGRETWNKGHKLTGEALEEQRERIKNRRKLSKEERNLSNAKRLTTMKEKGYSHSEETKRKQSESQKGIPRGPHDEETKKKIRAWGKDRPKPIGHSNNVSAAVLGNISINKDGKEKKVKQHKLQEFLNDGWLLGGRPRKKKEQS